MIASEEGIVDLDKPAIDSLATLADLLAHCSGLHPSDAAQQLAPPRTRRIYSNAGYETAAGMVADAAEMPFATYLGEAVFEPASMVGTALSGSPAHAGLSTVSDLGRFVDALTTHAFLAPETLRAMVSPWQPDLDGVLPGFGRQQPNPWGLGPEIRGTKQSHWTAPGNSPETWGHFGQTGTFLWVDPVSDLRVIVLTDQPFGPWAAELWPKLSAEILRTYG